MYSFGDIWYLHSNYYCCCEGTLVAIVGDGQVTFGENTIIKHTAKKVRKIYNGKVLISFAGSVGNAFTKTRTYQNI